MPRLPDFECKGDFATVIRSMIRTHRATYPALLKAVFRLKRAQEAQRGMISLSAHSILSTSSRITLIDCWFFEG